MSERVAEVVKVEPRVHNNADSLEIIDVQGWQAIAKKGQFQAGDLAVFVRPDEIIQTSIPEFAFMASKGERVRVKSCKLRGEYSAGLLIKARPEWVLGQNVYEELKLEHYENEPEFAKTGGDWEKAPSKFCNMSKFDVENLRASKVRSMFVDGEPVRATLKANGSNVGYVFTEGKMFVRSRSGFRKEEDNVFWRALKNYPQITELCKANPDMVLYGEVVNVVRGFKYGFEPGFVGFFAFDLMDSNRRYMSSVDFYNICEQYNVPITKIVYDGPFDYEKLLELAEMDSPYGDRLNEGICIRPHVERYCGQNRVIGKIVSNKYLDKVE